MHSSRPLSPIHPGRHPALGLIDCRRSEHRSTAGCQLFARRIIEEQIGASAIQQSTRGIGTCAPCIVTIASFAPSWEGFPETVPVTSATTPVGPSHFAGTPRWPWHELPGVSRTGHGERTTRTARYKRACQGPDFQGLLFYIHTADTRAAETDNSNPGDVAGDATRGCRITTSRHLSPSCAINHLRWTRLKCPKTLSTEKSFSLPATRTSAPYGTDVRGLAGNSIKRPTTLTRRSGAGSGLTSCVQTATAWMMAAPSPTTRPSPTQAWSPKHPLSSRRSTSTTASGSMSAAPPSSIGGAPSWTRPWRTWSLGRAATSAPTAPSWASPTRCGSTSA
ncbi:hypothetical protein BT67DRAFT_229760 [Trichocladium antarcticum]|uniref:Uncharacterized protein n=1 Tax=Trichocladium antarcticum TaxID=1450529 RepID=A0AAN6UNW1_9PEZI|nr:hypothetical protein BT67DRAFT_229760 [Trichocladium antarcticum]